MYIYIDFVFLDLFILTAALKYLRFTPRPAQNLPLDSFFRQKTFVIGIITRWVKRYNTKIENHQPRSANEIIINIIYIITYVYLI